jgi:hypothetical protein
MTDTIFNTIREGGDNKKARRYIVDPIDALIDAFLDPSEAVENATLLNLKERYPQDYEAIYVYGLVNKFFQWYLEDQTRFAELRELYKYAPQALDGTRSLNMYEVLDATKRGINNEPPPQKLTGKRATHLPDSRPSRPRFF